MWCCYVAPQHNVVLVDYTNIIRELVVMEDQCRYLKKEECGAVMLHLSTT